MTVTQFPAVRATCRECGSQAYTTAELNLHSDQTWSCYRCLDKKRRAFGEAMITQEAREAAADLAQKVYGRRIADCIRSGEIEQHHFLDAIAAAEQRGMERAAVIAEAEQWPKSHLDAAFRDGNSGPADYNEACTDIARAIRRAKEA